MGRKEKTVDAEMFIELAAYYTMKNERDLVDEAETKLFGYSRLFSERSTHFESLIARREQLAAQKPDLDADAIWDMLNKESFNLYLFRNKDLTDESFDAVRKEEMRIYREYLEHGKERYTLGFFKNRDIEIVNKHFQELSDETRKKLKGRLRKLKYKTTHRFSKKTYGIDIDSSAYYDIKSFADRYGLQTLSHAIMVMSEMANSNYEKGALKEAFKRVSSRLDIGEEGLFTKKKEVNQILVWVNAGQLYFSTDTYKYYLNVSLEAEQQTTNVCQIMNSSLISQLSSSERIVLGDKEHEMNLTGIFENGEIKQLGDDTKIDKITLKPVYMAEDERVIDTAIARLIKEAVSIFGDEEKADAWLNKPKESLDGLSPKESMKNSYGLSLVEKMLRQMEHGIY